MRRLVTTLVAALLAWFGVLQPAAAAPAAVTASEQAYAYDSEPHAAPFNDACTERGPPGSDYAYTTLHAVAHESHGSSARPGAREVNRSTAYDRYVKGVQVECGRTTTARPALGAQGDLRLPSGASVATNTGRTAARTCMRSFGSATLVLMADGSKERIEDVEVGDRVVATDPETGERVVREVTHLWVHEDELADLVLVDGSVLTTTEDHLFWSVTDHTFERADQLAAGEVVLGDGGRQFTVVGFRPGTERRGLAYNLAIAGVHTYHVGDDVILVHNECSDAAYQGMLHIRDEIARDPRGSHSWAANMTDDEITSYLDDFVTRGGGQRLDDGTLGWYDPDRGIAIIQRSEYSMTGYTMPYSDFLGRLAN